MEAIEKEFTDTIFKKTGKSINKGEYGFIAGLMHPLMGRSEMGYMSANNINGFQVWKKVGEDYESVILTPKNPDESLNQIVEFLNK